MYCASAFGHRNETEPVSRTAADLALSDHDRAAGMLLALVVLVGAVVGALAVVWLGMRWLAADAKAAPVRLVQVSPSAGDGLENLGLDALSPQDIARESDSAEPEFSETLRTVIEVAALPEADIDEAALFDEPSESAKGDKTPGGKGKGSDGDGDGQPGVPPHLRWEIVFADTTLDAYGRQLDAFGLELGMLGVPERGDVTYAKNFSKSPPDTYVGAAKDDTRLYMTWKKGKLRDADRALMKTAGVTGEGLILMFWPDEAEQQLLRLERDFQGRDASTIRKTRFGVRRKEPDETYEFYVIEQTPSTA
jgi:hypothetical protein